MTPVANSANIAAEIFSQAQTTLFSKQFNDGLGHVDIDGNRGKEQIADGR